MLQCRLAVSTKKGTHLSAFPDAKIMNFRGECKSELKEVYSCGDFC